jgi:membrane protein required for colicin V production
MSGVDVVLVVVLMAFALRGYGRGFFRESFGVLGLIAGVAAALQFTPWAMGLAQDRLSLPPVAQEGVAFVAVFAVVYAVLNVIGFGMNRLAGASRLWVVNRLAGAVIGIAKGGVVLAAVLLVLHLLPIVPGADARIMGSAVARPLVAAAAGVLQRGGREAQPGSANPA